MKFFILPMTVMIFSVTTFAGSFTTNCGYPTQTVQTVCGRLQRMQYCRPNLPCQPTHFEILDTNPACSPGTGRYLLSSDDISLMAKIEAIAQANSGTEGAEVCATGLIQSQQDTYPESLNVSALSTK